MKRTIILTMFGILIVNTCNASILKRSSSKNKLQQTQNSPSAEHILTAIKESHMISAANQTWSINQFNKAVNMYNKQISGDASKCKLQNLDNFDHIQQYIAELNKPKVKPGDPDNGGYTTAVNGKCKRHTGHFIKKSQQRQGN